MAQKRKIEIFSAGCPVCDKAVKMIEEMADENQFEVEILDMNEANVAARADSLGVASVPAVAIDGRLLECCGARGVDKDALRNAGVGA